MSQNEFADYYAEVENQLQKDAELICTESPTFFARGGATSPARGAREAAGAGTPAATQVAHRTSSSSSSEVASSSGSERAYAYDEKESEAAGTGAPMDDVAAAGVGGSPPPDAGDLGGVREVDEEEVKQWKPPKGFRALRGKSWCGTLNHYTDADIQQVRDLECSYIIAGREVGARGTPHLQLYVTFRTTKTGAAMMRLFKGRAHWERTKVDDAAKNYCMKDQDYILRDNRKRKGARTDFVEAADKIAKCSTYREMINNPELFQVRAKYRAWCDEQFYASRVVDDLECELRPWQKDIVTRCEGEAPPRKIYWYYDKKGGIGKSFLTKYLIIKHDAIVMSGGKSADLLYAYSQSMARIVVFDFSRTQEEYVPFQAMESIKDGTYLSTKYQSRMVVRTKPAHVIVFANFAPKDGALSADRLVRKQWVPQWGRWTNGHGRA